MKHNHRNVRHVKARRAVMMRGKCGEGARTAKGQEEGRVSRTHLVLAPDASSGRQLIQNLGWRNSRVAIVTDPDYLKDIAIYPGEDVYAVVGINPQFLKMLDESATMFCPGESYNLKMYVL